MTTRPLVTAILVLLIIAAVFLLVLVYLESSPRYTPIKYLGTSARGIPPLQPSVGQPLAPNAVSPSASAPTQAAMPDSQPPYGQPPAARARPQGPAPTGFAPTQGQEPRIVVISEFQARQAQADARALIERSACFAEADLRPANFNTGLTGVKFVGPLSPSRDFTAFEGAIIIELRGEKYDVYFHDEIPVAASLITGDVDCGRPGYDLSTFGYDGVLYAEVPE